MTPDIRFIIAETEKGVRVRVLENDRVCGILNMSKAGWYTMKTYLTSELVGVEVVEDLGHPDSAVALGLPITA